MSPPGKLVRFLPIVILGTSWGIVIKTPVTTFFKIAGRFILVPTPRSFTCKKIRKWTVSGIIHMPAPGQVPQQTA